MQDIEIIKYLKGKATVSEQKQVEDWILASNENTSRFNELKTLYVISTFKETTENIQVDQGYSTFIKTTQDKQIPLRKLYRATYKYAAIAILFIATTFGVYTILQTDLGNEIPMTEKSMEITLELEDGTIEILQEHNSTIITNKAGQAVVNQVQDKLLYKQTTATGSELIYNELRVPFGKRFTVALSDGTEVFLNAGTTLRYPRAFNNPDSRQVYLDGEAYFNVTENKTQPFIVNTQELNVRVLGTKFNVSSYSNENNTSTVLVEGSVGVYKPSRTFNENDKNLIIKPGEQAMIEEDIVSVNKVNINKHIAWTKGELHFINDRFETIIKELERHHNFSIENNNPELNDVRYTGTFLTESIFDILNTFKANTDFEYHIENNNQIIIEPVSL